MDTSAQAARCGLADRLDGQQADVADGAAHFAQDEIAMLDVARMNSAIALVTGMT